MPTLTRWYRKATTSKSAMAWPAAARMTPQCTKLLAGALCSCENGRGARTDALHVCSHFWALATVSGQARPSLFCTFLLSGLPRQPRTRGL